ncbi:hypothetical protein FA95DRAFT_1473409, partial [Auriscalpium vulgare]
RPDEVQGWIQSAQPWHKGRIGDLDKFVKACEDWWRALQPADRFNSACDFMVPTASMDWSSVLIASNNGLLSVMAALLWWGWAVKDDDGYPHERWLTVVVDVSTVL